MAITLGSLGRWMPDSGLFNHCGQPITVLDNMEIMGHTVYCKCGAKSKIDMFGSWEGWPSKLKEAPKAAEPQEDALTYFINNL